MLQGACPVSGRKKGSRGCIKLKKTYVTQAVLKVEIMRKQKLRHRKIAFLKTFYGFTFIVQYITKVIYYVTVTVPSIVTSEIQYVIIMDSEEKVLSRLNCRDNFSHGPFGYCSYCR